MFFALIGHNKYRYYRDPFQKGKSLMNFQVFIEQKTDYDQADSPFQICIIPVQPLLRG